MYSNHDGNHDAAILHLPEFQRRFAKRVRDLREQHELRQEDLENYGLSWKTVQKLEYGETDPKMSTLLKLSKAFDMPLHELIRFEKPGRHG